MEKQFSIGNPPHTKGVVCAFVLFLLAYAVLPLRSELPVIGDLSDVVWKGGHPVYPHYSVTFHPSSQYIAGHYGGLGTYVEWMEIADSTKKVWRFPGTLPQFSKSGKYLGYSYYSFKGEGGYDESGVKILEFKVDTIAKADSIVFWKRWYEISGGDYSPLFVIFPDEKTIAIGTAGGEGKDFGTRINLYNIETGELIRSKKVFKPFSDGTLALIYEMAYIPNNRIIFRVYKSPLRTSPRVEKTMIWDLEKDTIMETWWRFPVAVSFDERFFACAGGSGRTATVYDLTTGQEVGFVPAIKSNMGVEGLALSPEGRYLMFVFSGEGGDPTPNYINIWDVTLGKMVYVIPRRLAGYSCAFSPDGRYLAIGYTIFLLDFEKIKRKIEMASVPQPPQPLVATIIYPNPTHDVVQVKFTLDKSAPTVIKIVDLAGKEVKTIEDKILPEGEYVYTIDLTKVVSGAYYLQINAGTKNFNEQIVVSH
ncbi:T9SS C-terminal target domain-containing protein [Bacteroidetes/Chlorobi group bacterium Naka2016]|jgi:WD40 repeat protein|nr:MAG: T9SS C-terminal target domain-containing protein [Bacteroidetes/Chlorobi group bacterium Naka2016]